VTQNVGSPWAALVIDAVGGPLDGPATRRALGRVRAAGVRIAFVHDRWPEMVHGHDASTDGDVIVVPHPAERTVVDEVRPEFVRRVCTRLGTTPERCVVVGGRRPLLVAAAWAGAGIVMVPNESTPLFDVRALRAVAPDLASAIDALLAREPGSRVCGRLDRG
jgi:beta-phosphoglucomutase-like phosphatase (HAD superfamily)